MNKEGRHHGGSAVLYLSKRNSPPIFRRELLPYSGAHSYTVLVGIRSNGEVDITALETFLTGTFKFVVHKDPHLLWPRAETPTSYISMGFSPDLKEATTLAVRDMINFLVDEKH